ncbi:hypothetical protein BN871_BC_00240 [Paenibacillus sp. P22]|nr:hypothetical protein BN871_BC_00240 [Paenibacillus sp. P22]
MRLFERCVSLIDHDDTAIDGVSFLKRQQVHRACDALRLGQLASHDLGFHAVEQAGSFVALDNRRVDGSGSDGDDADSVRGKLESGRFAHHDDRAFRGVVGEGSGGSEEAEYGCRIDDGAFDAQLLHLAAGLDDAVGDAVLVDGNRFMIKVHVLLQNRTCAADAGVVEHDFQAAVSDDSCFHQIFHAFLRGNIDLDKSRFAAAVADELDRFAAAGFVEVRHDDLITLGCEFERGRPADAAGSACNNRCAFGHDNSLLFVLNRCRSISAPLYLCLRKAYTSYWSSCLNMGLTKGFQHEFRSAGNDN